MEIDATVPLLGLYLPEDFRAVSRSAREYRASLGAGIRVLSFYSAWRSGREGPDLKGIRCVMRSGFTPMLTWEPWWPEKLPNPEKPSEQPEFSLSEILRGRYDDYIREWALELKKIHGPILFRPMHEMTGNWYPWCEKATGNRGGEYVKAWRHIRSVFREVHCDGLIWVWSPYAHSVPDEPDMGRYYPGDGETDWLGLDGYNWGTTREWSSWRAFGEIFEEGYNRLMRLAPEKLLMIAEVGCAEEGGDKGGWIEDAFNDLPKRFPNVRALVWFNIDKECDWRIESSRGSAASFKRSVRRYLSRGRRTDEKGKSR